MVMSAHQLAEQALSHSQQGNYTQAAACYQQALKQDGKNPTLHFNLATMLRILGQLQAAHQHFDRAVQLANDDAEAWYFRSMVQRASDDNNHIAELEAKLKQKLKQKQLNPKLAVHLWYALGKECEDIQDWLGAKQAIENGARLRRQHLNYDLQGDLNVHQALQQHFNNQYFQAPYVEQAPAQPRSLPLFIIGLPRAGSTLLERILSGADDINIAGELTDLSTAMTSIVKQAVQNKSLTTMPTSMRINRSELVALASQVCPRKVMRQYLSQTQSFQQSGRYFIDKMPLNYLNLGLIAQGLPSAPVIHMKRQRDDHIWGMYRHLFTHAYPFSYALDELNAYYDAYQQLMAHWQQQLGDKLFTVNYEDLVTNPEATCQAIFAFIGVPWKTEYLAFHTRNQSPSATGSAAQIREPLSDRFIGHGKRMLT